MTKEQVFVKAFEKRISWLQAADILGVTPRHMRRIRWSVERYGMDALKDGRSGSRRKRIPGATIKELCRLKRELYADFSIRHFHEFATEKHGLKLSYTMARTVLQAAGSPRRRQGVASTVANVSADRWWACCFTSTPRLIGGCPSSRCRI